MTNIILNVQRLYMKNASFEIIDAPQSFLEKGQPENSVEMRINHSQLEQENHYEVVLTLTVTTKIEEKVLCRAQAEQAGIFKIENATTEQLDNILETYCPHVLYPYACHAISQLELMGSLPAIILQPIDFNGLYRQRQKTEKTE